MKSVRTLTICLLVATTTLFAPAAATAACAQRAVRAGGMVMPLLQSPQQAATGAAGPASIVGLWHVLFVSQGQPFDEGFDLWNSDGTEILNDTAPPQPANGAGTVCLGVYKKVGPRTYQLKHPFWSFDQTATLVGTGFITETVILDRGGNSYHGTFTFDLYDLSHKLILRQRVI